MSLRNYQKGTNLKLEINENGDEQGIDPRKLDHSVFGPETIQSPAKAIRANCIDFVVPIKAASYLLL